MTERTFCIIKPDAVRAGNAGAILAKIEGAQFKIVALRQRILSSVEAEMFYDVHRQRPFFKSLCEQRHGFPNIARARRAIHGSEQAAEQAEADATHERLFAGRVLEQAVETRGVGIATRNESDHNSDPGTDEEAPPGAAEDALA